jgi:hypothetical protein
MTSKIISLIITLSFICVFAIGFVYFIEPEIKIIKPKTGKSLDENYFGLPPPGDFKAVIPPRTSFIQVQYNEYIKAVSGAAIGWVVKEICQFLFSNLKNLFRKTKE